MEIIAKIDFISQVVASLCFILILLKLVTKRSNNKKADRLLMRIHKPVGCMLVVFGILHMVCSFRVIADTSIWVYILGTVSLVAIIAAIVTFILRKKGMEVWLIWHRGFTVIAIVTMVMHWGLIRH